ncbi:hypothetical protein BH10PSE4_BH10PSE4_17590 [soil metagenome]
MPKLAAPLVGAFAAILLSTTISTTPVHAQTPAVDAPRQVNVTSDSAFGWIPSREQEAAAADAATTFLGARDRGMAPDAYALLADKNQGQMPYVEFSQDLARFNTEAGAVIERRIVTTTWTKDSPTAPVPGVYAALDLVSRFERIDRHCGFLILYQAPTGGSFRVMRQEDNYIDNATAKRMSKAEIETTWARLSARCPNYAVAETQAPLPEQPGSSIGYPSVAAALAGLHKRTAVKFSTRDGWTVAIDTTSMAIWSFPPRGHPAYPAAVKREAVQEGANASLRMNVLCEAAKAPCDDLVRTFQQMNAQMQQGMTQGQ